MAFVLMLKYLCSTITNTWILLISIGVLTVIYQFYKNYKLPPGPIGLPFVGYGPFLSRNKAADLGRMSVKYKSDIISVNVYGRLLVVLNSYEIVKELFQKRTDLMDRADDASFCKLDPGYGGIIGTYGRFWKEHRRFAISMLRDFGMGRIAAEKHIQEETRCISEGFRSHKGRPFDPQSLINMGVSNVICTTAFGRRFEYTDPNFKKSLESLNRMMTDFSNQSHISQFVRMVVFSIAPLPLVGRIFNRRVEAVRKCYHGFANFSKMNVEDHKRTYDGTVNDLIDAYLKEMENREGDEDNVFDERQAVSLVNDLFLAGSETTYNSLRWALLYMAAYPDIQQKVHNELDDVIGPNRMPSMSDKKQTPYTEAVLSEVQRLNTLVPFGVLHNNRTTDVEVNGYIIPKMTTVAANLHHLHHDPKVWSNPDVFDPEHFLEDGKVAKLDKLVQFSIGRRSCAGEALARMELYIMFATWMKDFEIKLASDDTVPDLDGFHGGTYMPTPFQIRVLERYPVKADVDIRES